MKGRQKRLGRSYARSSIDFNPRKLLIYTERSVKSRKFSPGDRSLPIWGANRHYWANHEGIAGFETDIRNAKRYRINQIRFFCTRVMTEYKHTLKQRRDDLARIIRDNHDISFLPVLFSQAQIRTSTPIERQQKWIDFWVEAFPDLDMWEIYNEPVEGNISYYERIKNLTNYLREKTGAKITIGFHYRRDKAFQALRDCCDIIGYHIYPGVAHTAQYLLGDRDPKRTHRFVSFMSRGQNPYDEFFKVIDQLEQSGKPYIISEWGFAISTGRHEKKLEEYHYHYVRNVLSLMKQVPYDNLLGFHFYALREPFPKSVWNGILKYDGTPRPAAQLFKELR